jgi:hypothetical protein
LRRFFTSAVQGRLSRIVAHVGEGFARHVRMADQVVRLADQFVARKAGHGDEGRIAVLDAAGQIGRGYKHV